VTTAAHPIPKPRIPLPWGTDLQTWANLIVETFPQDWIPRLTDPQDWRRWAADFQGSPTFMKYVVPDPFRAQNWQEWASELILVVPFAP
jgi:hypothetical protein